MGGQIASLTSPRVPVGIWFLVLTGYITLKGILPTCQDEEIQDPGASDSAYIRTE